MLAEPARLGLRTPSACLVGTPSSGGPLTGPHLARSAGTGPCEDDVDLPVLHALGRFLLL